MTDGPQGPVIDQLSEVRYELMVLNEQIRQLLSLEAREIPAPVVNVAPTPITLPDLSQAGRMDLSPLLVALEALRQDDTPVVDVLEQVKTQLSDLGGAIRAIGAGSSYVGGAGPTHVTAEVYTPTGSSVATVDAPLDTRYQWQDLGGVNEPLYSGTAPVGAADSDNTWQIQKFTFAAGPAGGYVVTRIQLANGAWSDRATLLP